MSSAFGGLTDNVCRACLKFGDDIKFTNVGNNARYFKEYLNININSDKMCPHFLLCQECAYRISRILSFGDMVVAAEELLNKLQKLKLNTKQMVSWNDFRFFRSKLNFPSLTVHISDEVFETKHEENIMQMNTIKDETDTESVPITQDLFEKQEEEMDIDIVNILEIKKEQNDDDATVDNGETFGDDSDDDALKDIQDRLRSARHVSREFIKWKRANNADSAAKAISVLLTKEEALEELRKQATLPKYVMAEFKCEFCYEGFYFEKLLEDHAKRHDQSYGSFKCGLCLQYFVTEFALRQHESRHLKRFKCTECDFMRTCWSVVADHYSDVHERNNMRDIQCNVCGKTFSKQNTFRKHSCHQEKVKCDVCNKTMLKSSVNKHILDLHTKEKPFECEICKRRFAKPALLRLHASVRHPEGMEYCAECDLFFTTKGGLRNHLRMTVKHIKEEHLKQCPHCPMRLPYWKCSSHIERVHRAKRFPCTECDVSYLSRRSLLRHMQTVHLQIKKERKYVCETCGKAFTVKKTLDSHMNIHTGVRPYKCIACDATFAHPAALYTHNRLVHLKIKRKQDLKKTKMKAGVHKDPGDVTNADVEATASR